MAYTVPAHTVECNENWEKVTHPFFTILTRVYNRPDTIERAMNSVEGQTFRDIEYILVDDGSTISNDNEIHAYMKNSSLPVMYAKKANGGPHTASNLGIELARGEMLIILDTDDELLPDACKKFYETWQNIPVEKRDEYCEIRAQCVDINGELTGKPFPPDINELPREQAIKYFSIASGEQTNCNVIKLLKANRWPEPEGVTSPGETIVWLRLEHTYLSWGINDVVRVYHMEGDEHASGLMKKRGVQYCRNTLWSTMARISEPEVYCLGTVRYLKYVLLYCMMSQILKDKDSEFVNKYKVAGAKNKFWTAVMWLPSIPGAWLYKKKYM